jgi:thiol-disulfide isomerase/thioredoxin
MVIKRKSRYLAIFLLLSALLMMHAQAYAVQTTEDGGLCGPDIENSQECFDEAPSDKDANAHPVVSEQAKDEVSAKKKRTIPPKVEEDTQQELPLKSKEITVYFFWGSGCPHCKEEKVFLKEMQRKYPLMKVRDYEVWFNKENAALLAAMAKAYNIKTTGVPVTFISKKVHIGFSKHSREEIQDSIDECISGDCVDPSLMIAGKIPARPTGQTGESEKKEELECTEKSKTIYIPWVGSLDASEMSLPVMTLVIAGLDSFNPCAFFVLFSLLGLLIHAQSRRKMFLIGSIFVFFSGFIYFVFMAAWLNLFLVMGQVAVITRIAGLIAVVIAVINIKDYFVFKRGVSLTIPDSAKPKLFDRMRKLLKSTSVLSILVGTVVLAVTANAYELLCTAGFPMVFTRILTLNNLSAASHYLYLILYNLIYVVPLSIIVVLFTVTLGKKQLTEKQGRVMKLVSGTMMLGLGGALILDPAILSNALISFLLLLGALVVSTLAALLTKSLGYS